MFLEMRSIYGATGRVQNLRRIDRWELHCMSLRIWKSVSLLLIAALLITSCGSGPFAGEAGIQEAAQESQPKPPLAIAAERGPLPNPEAPLFVRPQPKVRPFSGGDRGRPFHLKEK